MSDPTIEPDVKDWTWVLDWPCPDCGYDAATVDRRSVGAAVRDDAAGWAAVLTVPDASRRPDPRTWSPLEYACHVRDVHRVMGGRLDLMLRTDDPTFDDWDQDATATSDGYGQQDPAVVARQLTQAADEVAAQYDALADAPDETWARPGRRSNGSTFSVDTLARYHLHDLVHHAHDVRAVAARTTATAYDADAHDFAEATAELDEAYRDRLSQFAEAVGTGGRVLEIGSGGGRDATALIELGLQVRLSDISNGFVDLLRSRGFEADRLDPLHDDLGGPYDGVWTAACLLHVARVDMPVVLGRLGQATRRGGRLGLSLKQGDGEAWSTHGTITAPRHFVYWQEGPLRAVLDATGWVVEGLSIERSPVNRQLWLTVLATRR